MVSAITSLTTFGQDPTNKTSNLKIETYFDRNTGLINPKLETVLKIVGISEGTSFDHFPPNHIEAYNRRLQEDCFKVDAEYFKKGSDSQLQFTTDDVEKFYGIFHEGRTSEMPREKTNADVIFPYGVHAKMYQRFSGFQEALSQGYPLGNIHVVIKDISSQNEIESLINEKFKDVIGDRKVNYVITNVALNFFEEGLKQLASNPSSLSGHVVIATDPTFAEKAKLYGQSIFGEEKFIGITSVPIENWRIEAGLHGYIKTFGSIEKAARPWLLAELNFVARQVNQELEAYRKTRQNS